MDDFKSMSLKSFEVTAAIVLDVEHGTAAGNITFEGAVPQDAEICDVDPSSNAARVDFEEVDHGYGFTYFIPCDSGDYAFDIPAWPGTYQVSVRSFVQNFSTEAGANFALPGTSGGYSSQQQVVVNESFTINAD